MIETVFTSIQSIILKLNSSFFNLTLHYSGWTTLYLSRIYIFPYNSTTIFAWKFLLMLSFLILIRGGTPRYRYDYLTKLGWLKFIGLVILSFFSVLLFFIIL